MNTNGGFWSYVHDDNDAEGGRITQLAHDLEKQYELISGDSIQIFLDRASLAWGEDWRDKVDSSLASILFFIAVLTPRYFQSAECRRELQTFARRAEALGVRELILPLLYVEFPEIDEETPVDELVTLVKRYQWVDWRDVRHEETSSAKYRRAVALLAERLMDTNQNLASPETSADASATVSSAQEPRVGSAQEVNRTPDLLDKLMQRKEALRKIQQTQGLIASEIDTMADLLQRPRSFIPKAADSTLATLTVGSAVGTTIATSEAYIIGRRLGRDLIPLVARLLELVNAYTTQLYDIDPAIRILIVQGSVNSQIDRSNTEQWCDLFNGVRHLTAGADKIKANISACINRVASFEKVSRKLRPPLQDLRRSLATVAEGNSMIKEWERWIAASDVECPSIEDNP